MSRARDLADGTFSGAFSADSPTLVVDSANNNVGIGTSSPTSASGGTGLDVDGMLVVRKPLAAHQTSAGVLEFNNNIVSLRAYGSTSGSGVLAFSTGGGGGSTDTERARFDSNGHLILKKNLVLESTSEGIDFSGVGSSAQTLDSYEEGTWTPITNGSPSYSYQLGHYTKVGNVVHFSVFIQLSVAGGASSLDITLPFTSTSSSNRYHAYQGWTNGWSSGANAVQWILGENTNYIRAYSILASGGVSGLLVNAVGTGNIIVTGSYRTD